MFAGIAGARRITAASGARAAGARLCGGRRGAGHAAGCFRRPYVVGRGSARRGHRHCRRGGHHARLGTLCLAPLPLALSLLLPPRTQPLQSPGCQWLAALRGASLAPSSGRCSIYAAPCALQTGAWLCTLRVFILYASMRRAGAYDRWSCAPTARRWQRRQRRTVMACWCGSSSGACYAWQRRGQQRATKKGQLHSIMPPSNKLTNSIFSCA